MKTIVPPVSRGSACKELPRFYPYAIYDPQADFQRHAIVHAFQGNPYL